MGTLRVCSILSFALTALTAWADGPLPTGQADTETGYQCGVGGIPNLVAMHPVVVQGAYAIDAGPDALGAIEAIPPSYIEIPAHGCDDDGCWHGYATVNVNPDARQSVRLALRGFQATASGFDQPVHATYEFDRICTCQKREPRWETSPEGTLRVGDSCSQYTCASIELPFVPLGERRTFFLDDLDALPENMLCAVSRVREYLAPYEVRYLQDCLGDGDCAVAPEGYGSVPLVPRPEFEKLTPLSPGMAPVRNSQTRSPDRRLRPGGFR